jgi:hypothetical protein
MTGRAAPEGQDGRLRHQGLPECFIDRIPACFIDWIPACAGRTGRVAPEGQDGRLRHQGPSGMLHRPDSSLLHRLDASLRWHDRTGGYAVPEGETIARVEHGAVRSSPDSSRSIGHPGAGSGHVSDEDPVGV